MTHGNLPENLRASSDERPDQFRAALIFTIVAGVLARVIISYCVIGSNDVTTYLTFGVQLGQHGLAATYQKFTTDAMLLNHPLLPSLWAKWAYETSISLANADYFPFVFRLPVIAADVISCWILFRIGATVVKPKATNSRRGLALAVAMACSPVAILASSYHGNTDSIYAMLSLLSAWLLIDRRASFAAGVAFAAALNIKLMPLVILPALLAIAWRQQSMPKFISGLSLGAIPYVIAVGIIGPQFLRNVFGYTPVEAKWGLPYVIELIARTFHDRHAGEIVIHVYRRIGTAFVLSGSIILTVLLRRLTCDRRLSYALVSVGYLWMLLAAPGFGVQYTVVAVPLLIACALRTAWLYSALVGLFLVRTYAHFCDFTWPFYSDFHDAFPRSSAMMGLLVLGFIVVTIVNLIRETPVKPHVEH